MKLTDLLRKEKDAVLRRWFDLILGTYPADAAGLLGKGKDRFTNPVGFTISREIAALFEELLDDSGGEKVSASLDSIIRIRSVQDFAPSKAVGFIFLLKDAVGETLKEENLRGPVLGEWLKFQSRVDELALMAFDVYTDCREKISEIRVNKARAEKEMAFRMMERMSYSKEKHQE